MSIQPDPIDATQSRLASPGHGRGAGIGLRGAHHAEVLAGAAGCTWLEVHSENFFAAGGSRIRCLAEIAERHPLSLHGVGLSLGSVDPLSSEHLRNLKRAVARFRPFAVSEHLCWSSVDGRFANDLLPLPYTEEALRHVSRRIQAVQAELGRQILVENVSSYAAFRDSSMTEWEFLTGVAEEAQCGVLLDINNVFVAAHNHGYDAASYIDGVPRHVVKELHLAGHISVSIEAGNMLIDTHSRPVSDAVWDLYTLAVRRFGAVPTLIEWDTDLPPLAALLAEAQKADRILMAVQNDSLE